MARWIEPGRCDLFRTHSACGNSARWLRPLAWVYALIMLLNGIGHTMVTVAGRTVASVPVPRPAPGFYSSPFLLAGSVWLMRSLWRTRG